MPIYTYPFKQLQTDIIPKPYIPIRIKNPDTGQFLNYYGLVDTGADMICIPAGIASIIGHNLTAVQPQEIGTAGSNSYAYLHSMVVDIFPSINGIIDTNTVIYSMNSEMHCTSGNNVLIGVKEFLKFTILNVDYPNQTFSITLSDV